MNKQETADVFLWVGAVRNPHHYNIHEQTCVSLLCRGAAESLNKHFDPV